MIGDHDPEALRAGERAFTNGERRNTVVVSDPGTAAVLAELQTCRAILERIERRMREGA